MVEAANWIAIVVAWNQPFYPLYLYGIVGDRLAPAFLTFLSTPVFIAIPFLSRGAPTLARALLPVTGMANTVLSAKALGTASGVEIFLIPCALIAAALFRPSERKVGLPLVAAALLVHILLRDRYGVPLGSYTSDELAAITTLNVLSAATLCVFVGLLVSGLIGQVDAKPGIPPSPKRP